MKLAQIFGERRGGNKERRREHFCRRAFKEAMITVNLGVSQKTLRNIKSESAIPSIVFDITGRR